MERDRTPRLNDLVAAAVLREARTQIAKGAVLLDANWVPLEEARRTKRRRVWAALGSWLLFLIYCALWAALGLGLLALTTLIA